MVDLDREGGALEMPAHTVGHVVEIGRQRRAVVGGDVVARAKAEPLRPGRRQFSEQAGGQLLDGVGGGAVKRPSL